MGSFTLTPQVPYSILPKTLICPHSLGPQGKQGKGGERRREGPFQNPPSGLLRPEMPQVENHSESSLSPVPRVGTSYCFKQQVSKGQKEEADWASSFLGTPRCPRGPLQPCQDLLSSLLPFYPRMPPIPTVTPLLHSAPLEEASTPTWDSLVVQEIGRNPLLPAQIQKPSSRQTRRLLSRRCPQTVQ